MSRRHLLRFEGKRDALLPRPAFFRRVARNFGASAVLIGGSLLIGMLGYAGFEGMSAVDAFANASMILSGMGPLDAPKTTGGKLFAGCYAPGATRCTAGWCWCSRPVWFWRPSLTA